MSRRKGPKVEAWAAVAGGVVRRVGPERDDVQGLMSDVNFLADGGRVVRLVPADPDREAVVRAAVKAHEANKRLCVRPMSVSEFSRLVKVWHAALAEERAAVEKLQRKGRK